MQPRRALAFQDLAPSEDSYRDALWHGLAQKRKAIPCRFFYDARGSALFEEICRLPEYYPTRTEIRLLEDCAEAIAGLTGRHCRVVEFGSGASRKVRTLLAAFRDPAAYVGIDIAEEQLRRSCAALAEAFPEIAVTAICGDYAAPFSLPAFDGVEPGRWLGFFPGSTIGNLEPAEARSFLAGCARRLGRGGAMLVGVDLKKDRRVLEAAYNDAAGVTAAFNLNLLKRANREAEADFALDAFAHQAVYNVVAGRIEMYLKSLAEQTVTVAGRRFDFAWGELVHTENSYKYGLDEFRELAAEAGFTPLASWSDPEALFSLHYLAL